MNDVDHLSAEKSVQLTQEPQIRKWGERADDPSILEWMALDEVRAYLTQVPGESTRIHLGRGDSSGVHLTLSEARQLAAVLVELVDSAETGQ